MPFAARESWEKARVEWESDPEMTFSQVAERLNVALPTVSIRARRECWAKVVSVDIERTNYAPSRSRRPRSTD